MTRSSYTHASLAAALLLTAAPLYAGGQTNPQLPVERPVPQVAPKSPQTPVVRSPVVRSIEERRAIAKKAAHFEANYRNRVARLQRLIQVYTTKGDEARVNELQRLREKLELRREHAMQGFREDLGESDFKRFQAQLNEARRRKLAPAPGDRVRDETRKEKPPDKTGGGESTGGGA